MRNAPPAVVLASRFLALTAVRLAALRGARWEEIEDLDGIEPLWRVPAARMKLAAAKKRDDRQVTDLWEDILLQAALDQCRMSFRPNRRLARHPVPCDNLEGQLDNGCLPDTVLALADCGILPVRQQSRGIRPQSSHFCQ